MKILISLKTFQSKQRLHLLPLLILLAAILACTRSGNPPEAPWSVSNAGSPLPGHTPTSVLYLPSVREQDTPGYTPTPDQPRPLPTTRIEPEEYVVRQGDTLGKIAQHYHISLEALIQANDLANPNILSVGQVLVIPAPTLDNPGPGFKIIPDSELIYGPGCIHFDISGFVTSLGGYLAQYEEEVEGQMLTGIEIVKRVAQDYSVNPRLLLAVLEYQSGWVTQANPKPETLEYPIGVADTWRKGLYLQLAWAANSLNRGYYLWRANGIGTWLLSDEKIVPIDPTINAGTAGVQGFFALLHDRPRWEVAVSEVGLFRLYSAFFGYPFNLAIEQPLPSGLYQPQMQLPFEPGVEWAYTGGPHGGWGDGSAWAALDFAPRNEALGCVQSDAWVVAVADGLILRAANGAVIQDLDGDGLEQTGWVVLYMHVEGRDRVAEGTYLRAGERIGHPSCEGGFSSGTHLHIARRYNGEWIPADQTLPFVLDGWVSRGTGVEYDGFLQRNYESVEAWEGFFPENTIRKDP